MKLLIVRHADPDYSIDSLTPVGWEEAELLSARLSRLEVKQFYVSPLGRAKDTASLTLKKLGRTAEECLWLREFPVRIFRPDKEEASIAWDWLPSDWTGVPSFYDKDSWYNVPVMEEGQAKEEYCRVAHGIDQLLSRHGYVREKNGYRAEAPNKDTLVLFCHFGVECVILSHLFGISPMVLWHHFCALPSSVTTIVTEERRKGTASFRMLSFGDTSHLYVDGREPSFSARFCETFDDEERHD